MSRTPDVRVPGSPTRPLSHLARTRLPRRIAGACTARHPPDRTWVSESVREVGRSCPRASRSSAKVDPPKHGKPPTRRFDRLVGKDSSSVVQRRAAYRRRPRAWRRLLRRQARKAVVSRACRTRPYRGRDRLSADEGSIAPARLYDTPSTWVRRMTRHVFLSAAGHERCAVSSEASLLCSEGPRLCSGASRFGFLLPAFNWEAAAQSGKLRRGRCARFRREMRLPWRLRELRT